MHPYFCKKILSKKKFTFITEIPGAKLQKFSVVTHKHKKNKNNTLTNAKVSLAFIFFIYKNFYSISDMLIF